MLHDFSRAWAKKYAVREQNVTCVKIKKNIYILKKMSCNAYLSFIDRFLLLFLNLIFLVYTKDDYYFNCIFKNLNFYDLLRRELFENLENFCFIYIYIYILPFDKETSKIIKTKFKLFEN